MNIINRHPRVLMALLLLPSLACGKLDVAKKSTSSGGTTAAGGTDGATNASDVSNLEVLSPGALATKIYSAFGSGMTKITVNKADADYLLVNQANFVGSISSDPSNRYASSFSIGYFMALAGLAQVVGDNYNAALTSKLAVNDCRQTAGAQAILTAIAPTMTADESTSIAAALVTACTANPSAAASAVVQSYSTALKNTL